MTRQNIRQFDDLTLKKNNLFLRRVRPVNPVEWNYLICDLISNWPIASETLQGLAHSRILQDGYLPSALLL